MQSIQGWGFSLRCVSVVLLIVFLAAWTSAQQTPTATPTPHTKIVITYDPIEADTPTPTPTPHTKIVVTYEPIASPTPTPTHRLVPTATPEPRLKPPGGVRTINWSHGKPLVERPIMLQPGCMDATGPEVMLGAAKKSMEEFGWKIETAQADYFHASACRGGPKSFCVWVDVFYVNGSVEVWQSPLHKHKSRIHRNAKRYVGFTRDKFPEVQCGDKEELEAAYQTLLRRRRPSWRLSQLVEVEDDYHAELQSSRPGWPSGLRSKRRYVKEGEYLRWLNWAERYGR